MINNTKNVEFIGLPGSGKTTILNVFMKEVSTTDNIFEDFRSFHLFLQYNKEDHRIVIQSFYHQ